MIRHVVVLHMREDASGDDVQAFLDALFSLRIDGMVSCTAGPDLGIRPDCADMAMVLDFEDEAAWRRFDTDPEHVALRASIGARVVERTVTCQFALPAGA